MNIIHTWSNISSKPDYTNKRTIFQMIISLLCAKKYYDKVFLYTTSEVYDVIKSLELPYDKIDTEVLDNLGYDGPNFAIPKMEVYRHQTEPFLHIDTDTLLLNYRKIPEHKRLVFAMPDVIHQPRHDKRIDNSRFISFYEYYYELFIQLKDTFEGDFFKTMPMDFIPNMSIFGGYDVENIRKTYDFLVKYYFDNREILDRDTFRSPQIVEQLLFFPIYNKITGGKLENWLMFESHTEFYSQYPSLSIIDSVDKTDKISIISNNFKVMEIDKNTGYNDNTVTSSKDFYNCLISYDFCGYLHLANYKIDDFINNGLLQRLFSIKDINHNNVSHLETIVEGIVGEDEITTERKQKVQYKEGLGMYYYKRLCDLFPEKELWEDGNKLLKKLL